MRLAVRETFCQRSLPDRFETFRRHDLRKSSVFHDRRPPAEMPNDPHVMRDHDDRETERPLQLAKQAEYLLLQDHVQRGNRFVAQKDIRPDDQRPRQRDALTLAGAELGRAPFLRLRIDAHFQIVAGFLVPLPP